MPKTHNLKDLLNLLLPLDGSLKPLNRGLISLTRYGVEYRYPGLRATAQRMATALRRAEQIRGLIREKLGLLF